MIELVWDINRKGKWNVLFINCVHDFKLRKSDDELQIQSFQASLPKYTETIKVYFNWLSWKEVSCTPPTSFLLWHPHKFDFQVLLSLSVYGLPTNLPLRSCKTLHCLKLNAKGEWVVWKTKMSNQPGWHDWSCLCTHQEDQAHLLEKQNFLKKFK